MNPSLPNYPTHQNPQVNSMEPFPFSMMYVSLFNTQLKLMWVAPNPMDEVLGVF